MHEFPTMVYRCPGAHFAHDGQTYDYAKVEDEGDLSAALSAGWHKTLVDAVSAANGVKAEPSDDDPVTRKEIERMADDLGIKYDGRTSDAGLLKKIEAATSGGD